MGNRTTVTSRSRSAAELVVDLVEETSKNPAEETPPRSATSLGLPGSWIADSLLVRRSAEPPARFGLAANPDLAFTATSRRSKLLHDCAASSSGAVPSGLAFPGFSGPLAVFGSPVDSRVLPAILIRLPPRSVAAEWSQFENPIRRSASASVSRNNVVAGVGFVSQSSRLAGIWLRRETTWSPALASFRKTAISPALASFRKTANSPALASFRKTAKSRRRWLRFAKLPPHWRWLRFRYQCKYSPCT